MSLFFLPPSLFFFFLDSPKCRLGAFELTAAPDGELEARRFEVWFVYGILRQELLVLIQASSVLQYLSSPSPLFQVKNRGVVILSLPDSQGCCEAQLVNYSKASE